MKQLEFSWLTERQVLGSLCFWGALGFELERRCPHGRWDPSLGKGERCIYCDSGNST